MFLYIHNFLFFLFFSKATSILIGSATSAYQIEGHLPGVSIWDTFTQIKNLQPVGNASNHYLLYKDDVKLMYDLNLRNYRFSISWTRIMPHKWNVIDNNGIQFYHNLLDELSLYNITPYVTLYHWDLPEYLSPGWINPEIVEYFLNYSKIIFSEYDSKVKFWMTINEPLTTSLQGYETGEFAPGLRSLKYLSGHYQLLAHAYVASFYKEHYNGKIGIVLNANWFIPKNNNTLSHQKAHIALMKNFGWFADPIFFGNYPKEILEDAGNTLPPFTEEEKLMLASSSDFLGLNHYTSYYIDEKGDISVDPNWTRAQSSWLYSVPYGMYKILHFIKDRYGNIPIYITECGFSMKSDTHLDVDRIQYLTGYLSQVIKSEKEGVNVKIFFVWSLLDNFEWASGYNETFGIVYVDNINKNYTRIPKKSALILSEINDS
jgi:beta-glucosidase/6-phospho-beta-glucosidase/beta-galactosidase